MLRALLLGQFFGIQWSGKTRGHPDNEYFVIRIKGVKIRASRNRRITDLSNNAGYRSFLYVDLLCQVRFTLRGTSLALFVLGTLVIRLRAQTITVGSIRILIDHNSNAHANSGFYFGEAISGRSSSFV